MKKNNSCCDSELLNRLYDGEITPEENASLLEHLKTCKYCQKQIELNKEISKKYEEKLNSELSGIDLAILERKTLERIHKKKVPFWVGIRNSLTSIRSLVPAAAVTGIAFFLFSAVRGPSPDSPPSAIINSFTGEVSSVMILETPQSHQTIIWINET